MMDNLPPGVRVQVKEITERCGKCNTPFTMEVYLEPLTEKKSYRILCKECQYIVPLEEEPY